MAKVLILMRGGLRPILVHRADAEYLVACGEARYFENQGAAAAVKREAAVASPPENAMLRRPCGKVRS